jgi:hypothetical protein
MTALPRPFPLLLVALLAGAVQAQTPSPGPTYRSVGPDGKVTFTDRKPTDAQAHTRELGHLVAAPLVTANTRPFDLHPATTPPPATRSDDDGMRPPVDVSGKPFPPGLPDAILDVMVHQYFVQSLTETCGRLRPSLIERYQGGVLNWRSRNVEILEKSNHITFARFTAEQRDTLRATARARLEQIMPAHDLPEADRTAWCDRMSTDLARHQFELVGDMRLAPLLVFEAP